MSKDSAIRFLRELRTNEKAKELLQGIERPKNKDDAIKAYAEIAAELGEDISPEDFAGTLEEIEAEIHQRTEAVSADMEELDDDDMEYVAGGVYRVEGGGRYGKPKKIPGDCVDTFDDSFCLINDACERVSIGYYGCDGYHLGEYEYW